MRRALAAVAALVLLLLTTSVGPARADVRPVCRFSDPRLTEISGITWSWSHAGVWWVHNDSGGGPYVYAVDGATCRTLARIRVAGIGARDLEAVGTGVDPRGRKVLWLADIGDNVDGWRSVRLHAIVEPRSLVDQTVRATTYRFTYADGPHNAEAILVSPTRAEVYVITKQLARGGLYRVPLQGSGVAVAQRIADVRGLVTDAAMSPDGTGYVVRDYLGATIHPAPVGAATIAAGSALDVPDEPQGEAISFTRDGTSLVVASERDVRLLPVSLSSPTPTATSSAQPTATASDPAPATSSPAAPAADGSTPTVLRLVAFALLVVAAAAVAVWAARRFRH